MSDTVLSHIARKFTSQTENLATEALAFVLKRSRAVQTGLLVLASECGCQINEDLRFETQLANEDQSRPDLVGINAAGKLKLILEAKFWAGLTASQPVAYLKAPAFAEGGLLLFVAPKAREDILWNELVRRSSVELSGVQLIRKDFRVFTLGTHVLALTSWQFLINFLSTYASEAGDLEAVSDLRQLSGLCEQMDNHAFLPLSSEELTSALGQRVIQFCELAHKITDILVQNKKADVSGLRAAGGHAWYGRYMRVKGYGAVLQFSAWNWSKWGESPLWFGVKGADWKFSPEIQNALRKQSIHAKVDLEDGYLFVPIRLATGAEEHEVIAEALAQILRIEEVLPVLTGLTPSAEPEMVAVQN